jgi:hypothetical protein
MHGLETKDKKIISLLLSPSWFSGVLAVIVGLVLSVGVIVAFSANNSSIQQQLVSWQQNQPEVARTYQPDANKPNLKNSWPLLIVWSVIGLIVYTIAGAIIHSISKAEQIHESLGYVHANPDKMIKLTTEHVIMRVLAAISFGIILSLFIKNVIPYSITAAHASAADALSATGVLYALLSFSIVVVSLHLQTIFLRMSLGRARLFSDVI